MDGRAKLAGLFLLVVSALSACSLRYDFTECETDADCLRIEHPDDGQYYQCVQSECVLEQSRECRLDTQCGSGERCDNGACQLINPPDDAGDGGDADAGDTSDDVASDVQDEPDAPSTSCASTQDCIDRFGDSYYCAPFGECVDTAHAQCDELYYPDRERGDVVILGSIIPTEGVAYQSIGETIDNGVRMAVIEYASNVFTLPGGETVAYLHCQGGSAATAEEVARHMRDIGVPVVVGPLTSSTFIDVARNVIEEDADDDGNFDNPMGAIAVGATAPAIGNLDSAGQHTFQIISNDRYQTSAMTDRTHDLRWRSCATPSGDPECTDDASCQAHFGPDYVFDDTKPDSPCKDSDPQIAVFYKDDQYGRGFQSLLISRYTDRYPQATVKYYKYANPADLNFDEVQMANEFSSVITEALAGPDALPGADQVVFIGTGEAAQLAHAYIGAIFDQAGAQGVLSKRYIVSHGAAADVPNIFAGPNGLDDAFLGNVEAIAPNIFNEPYYTKWQNRYSIAFSSPAKTSVGGLAYDAAYMAIFAMAGVPDGQQINGTNVTKVLSDGRLQNADAGTELILDNTASTLGDAKAALGDGEDIDLIGVSGDLDFVFDNDVNQGTVRSTYLGLDVTSRQGSSGDTVYEGVPTRVYVLAPDQNFGQWAPIPTP